MSDFSGRLQLDRIRDGDRHDLSAGEAERGEIAERLGLLSLERLDAHVALTRDGERIQAKGRLRASLEQACVASGEPVPGHVDEPFELSFLPAPIDGKPDEEIELGADELDTIFYDSGGIELGQAIADTLALALDPYPRSASADAALKEAGVMSEEEASPFAVLAALKGKMGE